MSIEKLKLPKGRIVGGHPVTPEKKLNFQTRQPVIGKDGQPVMQYRVEYAIPKQEFLTHVWPLMQQEALTAFPNWQSIINAQTGLPLETSDFSWKLVDGDSPACPKGSKVPYNTREGYPGHYVLTIKTEAFAPGCSVFKNGAYHNVEANQVKCGDYIIANVDIKVHTNNDGGLYINPNGFELVELGAAINTSGGGNPDALFGDATARSDAGFQGQLPTAGQIAPQLYTGTATAPVAAAPLPQAFPAQQTPQAVGVYPSNPAPQPAYDLVQNAVAGNLPPAAAAPSAGLPQTGQPSAVPATTYPGNNNPAQSVPGLPTQR